MSSRDEGGPQPGRGAPVPAADVELTLARIVLQEADLAEFEAFIGWAFARNPAGPRIRQLVGYVPLSDELALDFLAPAVHEAGLRMPSPLEAALALARHEMRRVVSGAIAPEEGAGNIDNLVAGSGLDHDEVSRIPALWNFCVYRRYLRAACDMEDDAWYRRVVADIVAEAGFHLGRRERPPD